MGFESSRVARRRLAMLAATNDHVQEALAPSAFPGLFDPSAKAARPALVEDTGAHGAGIPAAPPVFPAPASPAALVEHLDELAQDIVATPGAGGALLAAYAAQARALTLVLEAARRAEGAPLPAAVLLAAQSALIPPQAIAALQLF